MRDASDVAMHANQLTVSVETVRTLLRDDLQCEDLEWERGKAWTFEQSMGAVWYYVERNPGSALIEPRRAWVLAARQGANVR
jgi:hypothetical protein